MTEDSNAIAAAVKAAAGIPTTGASAGPDDESLEAGVRAFAAAFEYWYVRVIKGVVPQYRQKIVARINPFVRRIELADKSAREAAEVIVDDYTSRQFVTAGGWAIEALAASAGTAQKSATAGIDLQRHVKSTNDFHLYVIKSGTVTRNSDILKALKDHARRAEQVLRQDKSLGRVVANYVVAAGRTTSTFADGIRRPSSAEFWSEMLELPEDEAVELALAMADVAGKLIQSDADYHESALITLVEAYIAHPDSLGEVDWEFLAARTMRDPSGWRAEDGTRHGWALEALASSGYDPDKPMTSLSPADEGVQVVTVEEAAAVAAQSDEPS